MKRLIGSIVLAAAFLIAVVSSVHGNVPGSWLAVDSHTTTTLHGIFWRTTQDAWLVGDNGTVLKVDMFVTPESAVEVKNSGLTADLYGVSFPEKDTGWVAGSSGLIARTRNKGLSWDVQSSGTTADLRGVAMTDIYHGWAVGLSNTILRTVDGVHWSAQNSGFTGADFYAVQALDGTTAWVVGRETTNGFPVILQTTDRGSHWNAKYTGDTAGSLRALHFRDATHGWVVGENGSVLRTDDGGNNWTPYDINGVRATFTGVWCSDDGLDIWVSGSGSLVAHSGDSGATWTLEPIGSSANLTALSFFNAYGGTGAVGSDGTFLIRDPMTRTLTSYHVPVAPAMDGNLDEWQHAPLMPLNYRTAERVSWHTAHYTGDLQNSNVGIRSAWDAGHLYFSVVITDNAVVEDSTPAKPWYDDEIELGLDGGERFTFDVGYPRGLDHQYTINPSGYKTNFGYINATTNPPPPITVATARTTSGWNIEVSVPYSQVENLPLYAGRVLGFTFGYHDDDDGGGWDTYYIWEGTSTNSNFGGFGNLQLSDEVLPGMPTPTPTATSTPTPTPTATPTPNVGTIRAIAWIDDNGNGILEPGEGPLPNAYVQFLENGSQLVAADYTDMSGTFTVTNLSPAFYLVTETNPPGYRATTSQTQSVFLQAGQTQDVQFGAQPLVTATPTPTVTPTITPTDTTSPTLTATPTRTRFYLPMYLVKGT